MSSNDAAPEKYLDLPGGRTLAYAESGNPSSSTLIIFFHGAFGVGKASHLPRTLLEKGIHYVAPTLPGWGKTSPRNKHIPYHISFASDITALIDHLRPQKDGLKLYIAGGSYGTVHAQMLYGAPFDIFPPGRYVAGCILLAPFSPFKIHTDYTKSMTMPNYISVGPPSQYLPFHLVPRMTAAVMGSKLKTVDKATTFVRETLFDTMGEEERAAFAKWKKENGMEEGQLERDFGENMARSVQETWDGYLEVSDVIHGDWGFSPGALDEEHNRRPILIVASEGDTMAPDAMAKWLAATYKNAQLRSVTGGHLATLFHLNDLWNELLEM